MKKYFKKALSYVIMTMLVLPAWLLIDLAGVSSTYAKKPEPPENSLNIVLNPIGNQSFDSFPASYNVTGTVNYYKEVYKIKLNLLINGIPEGDEYEIKQKHDKTFDFSLPWDITSAGDYNVKITAQKGGDTGEDEEDITVSLNQAPDTTAPTVLLTDPDNNETDVAIDLSEVTATFDDALDGTSVDKFSFVLSNTTTMEDVLGTVSYKDKVATFTLSEQLKYGTTYEAYLASTITDLAGNSLAEAYSFTFITVAEPDTTPPAVDVFIPKNGSVDVDVDILLIAQFSEKINGETLNFTLENLTKGGAVAGTVEYLENEKTATLKPLSDLEHKNIYKACILAGLEDVSDNKNALAEDQCYYFVTIDKITDEDTNDDDDNQNPTPPTPPTPPAPQASPTPVVGPTPAPVVLDTTPTLFTPTPVIAAPEATDEASDTVEETKDSGIIKGAEDEEEDSDFNWTPWITLFIIILLAGAITGGYLYWFAAKEKEEDKSSKENKGSAKTKTAKAVVKEKKKPKKKAKRW